MKVYNKFKYLFFILLFTLIFCGNFIEVKADRVDTQGVDKVYAQSQQASGSKRILTTSDSGSLGKFQIGYSAEVVSYANELGGIDNISNMNSFINSCTQRGLKFGSTLVIYPECVIFIEPIEVSDIAVGTNIVTGWLPYK